MYQQSEGDFTHVAETPVGRCWTLRVPEGSLSLRLYEHNCP
jgi:hypothetical protein